MSPETMPRDRTDAAEQPPRVDWILLAILALALALRCVDLQQPLVDAFSWRESSTAMMADNFQSGSWNIFLPEVSWTGPGPSYQGRELQLTSFLCAILNQVFGWHDWFGRLVGALCGTATAFFLFRIARLVWSRAEAYAGAAAFAILPGAIVIDRSYLPDPGMLALVTAGVWMFVRHVDEQKRRHLVAATTLVTLGVLAKLPGFAVAIPLAYVAIPLLRPAPTGARRWTWQALAAASGLVTVVAYYAWAAHLAISFPPHHMAGSGYIWSDGIAEFARNAFYLDRLWSILTEWFATPPFLLLMAIGIVSGPQFPPPVRGTRLLFEFWLLGALLLFLAGAREIVNNPWNLHVASVPLAAFAGRGLVVAAGWSRTNGPLVRRVIATTAIGAVLLGAGTYPGFNRIHFPYAAAGRELGQALARYSAPGDLVIAVSVTAGDPVAIYYSRRRGWVFPPGGGKDDWSKFGEDATSVDLLQSLMGQGARWFGIAARATDSQRRGFFNHYRALVAYLEKNAVVIIRSDNYLIYKLPDLGPTASP